MRLSFLTLNNFDNVTKNLIFQKSQIFLNKKIIEIFIFHLKHFDYETIFFLIFKRILKLYRIFFLAFYLLNNFDYETKSLNFQKYLKTFIKNKVDLFLILKKIDYGTKNLNFQNFYYNFNYLVNFLNPTYQIVMPINTEMKSKPVFVFYINFKNISFEIFISHSKKLRL